MRARIYERRTELAQLTEAGEGLASREYICAQVRRPSVYIENDAAWRSLGEVPDSSPRVRTSV